VVGVTLGILMGRSRRVRGTSQLPLVSIGGADSRASPMRRCFLLVVSDSATNPPVCCWSPSVSAFPDHLQPRGPAVEGGGRKSGCGRAQAMGADDRRLFVKVIVPGALPLHPDRIAARPRAKPGASWSASRMLAAVALGTRLDDLRRAGSSSTPGRDARRPVVVIGIIGLALEKLVFQKIEEYTVMRWGMMT